MNETLITCNSCKGQMQGFFLHSYNKNNVDMKTETDDRSLSFGCPNHECDLYALLQIPLEIMNHKPVPENN